MSRKKKHEEHVNHERWLVSYADFITLLFAFFTTLYAISTVDAKKAGKLVYSMRSAFDNNFFNTDKPMLGADSTEPPQMVSGTVNPRIKPVRMQGMPKATGMGMAKMKHLLDGVTKVTTNKQLGDLVHVRREQRGVVISLDAGGFFANGSADLTLKARNTLNEISKVLLQASLPLRVEGHTDASVLKSRRYRSNWELSTARAVSVVEQLIEKHAYPPTLLSAGGFGDTRPLVPNDNMRNRSINRRVDIVVLRDMLPPPLVHHELNDRKAPDDDDEEE